MFVSPLHSGYNAPFNDEAENRLVLLLLLLLLITMLPTDCLIGNEIGL
jgi:hypothetical protein